MVRLLWVVLSVGKVEFGVRMGGMVVVGGVLAGGLGLGNTVVGLVGVLIGLLHLGRCLGAGIVVGLSEGGIVVVGGNVIVKALGGNNKKRSHTQLDSRKQVIAFQDRVITINIKEAQHPLKREKQVIDKSSIMLKISTKSMHRVLV